jgi:hypothetical protein
MGNVPLFNCKKHVCSHDPAMSSETMKNLSGQLKFKPGVHLLIYDRSISPELHLLGKKTTEFIFILPLITVYQLQRLCSTE